MLHNRGKVAPTLQAGDIRRTSGAVRASSLRRTSLRDSEEHGVLCRWPHSGKSERRKMLDVGISSDQIPVYIIIIISFLI